MIGLPPHYWAVKIMPDEVKSIESMGISRNKNGKALGWVSKTANNDYSWDTIGLAGEYAMSLITGMKINRITGSTKQELNTGDLGNIEVKTRKDKIPSRWDLAVNADQLHEDRIYVLCLAHLWPKYVIAAGWAYGSDIAKDHTTMKHGSTKHTFLVYDRLKLNRIHDLFDAMRVT
jgi:hypothetical protein